MASNNYKQHGLVNGPSKFDLMVSNFHGDFQNRNVVSFQLAKGSGAWLDVIIDGNCREDGSGENWLLSGYVWIGSSAMKLGPKFEAYFNTKSRKGWIRIFRGEENPANVRKYRIVIRNATPDGEVVANIVRDELGDVKIEDWRIEQDLSYHQGGPLQRLVTVIVNYKE